MNCGFPSGQGVAFIGIIHISYGDAVSLHCRDDLLGLGDFDPHVVGALADQQRPHNLPARLSGERCSKDCSPALVV